VNALDRSGALIIIVSAIALLILGHSLAWGCSCVQRDEKQRYDDAEAVFLAEITDTHLRRAGTAMASLGDVIEAKITVLEYFKKPAYEIATVSDLSFGFGNCSIGLMSGMTYIFYVAPSKIGLGGLVNYVGMCTGSQAVNPHYKDFDKILARMRSYGVGK